MATTMSRTRVSMSVEAWDQWLVAMRATGDAATTGQVTGLQHQSAVVQLGGLLDVTLDPLRLVVSRGEGQPFGPVFPTTTWQGTTLPLIGSRATNANLLAMKRNTSTTDLFLEQKRYAGAVGQVLVELGRGSVDAVQTERTGGALILAIPAGYYVVAGIVSLGLVTGAAVATWMHENAATRRMADVTARAGTAYAQRIAVFRQTGTMPPASEVETGARDAISAQSETFWSNFGTGLGQAATTSSKYLAFGALALAVLAMSRK